MQQLLLLVEAGCLGRFLLGAATFSHLIIAAACNGHVDLPVRPFRSIRHAFWTLQHYCLEASGLLTQGGSEYTVGFGVPLKCPVVRCRPGCTEACCERWSGLYCDIEAMKEGVSSVCAVYTPVWVPVLLLPLLLMMPVVATAGCTVTSFSHSSHVHYTPFPSHRNASFPSKEHDVACSVLHHWCVDDSLAVAKSLLVGLLFTAVAGGCRGMLETILAARSMVFSLVRSLLLAAGWCVHRTAT